MRSYYKWKRKHPYEKFFFNHLFSYFFSVISANIASLGSYAVELNLHFVLNCQDEQYLIFFRRKIFFIEFLIMLPLILIAIICIIKERDLRKPINILLLVLLISLAIICIYYIIILFFMWRTNQPNLTNILFVWHDWYLIKKYFPILKQIDMKLIKFLWRNFWDNQLPFIFWLLDLFTIIKFYWQDQQSRKYSYDEDGYYKDSYDHWDRNEDVRRFYGYKEDKDHPNPEGTCDCGTKYKYHWDKEKIITYFIKTFIINFKRIKKLPWWIDSTLPGIHAHSIIPLFIVLWCIDIKYKTEYLPNAVLWFGCYWLGRTIFNLINPFRFKTPKGGPFGTGREW